MSKNNFIFEEQTYLANKNPHERDTHISFDEGPHIYTIDGERGYTSVTTWCHSHFEHFNPDNIIDKMMKSNKWPQSKYYGMTKQQIKDLWDKNGKEASTAGTKMHYDIECFYNNQDVNNDSVEFKYFTDFYNKHKNKIPYRTEWMVYDKELKFAGSIDMTYINKDGTIDIYDWKRCKEIKTHNKWQSSKTNCISHLPDTNYWHYSLQLNTYKYILEKQYGKQIKNMYLVVLHPNNHNGTFIKYKVHHLDDEMNDLIKLRRKNLI